MKVEKRDKVDKIVGRGNKIEKEEGRTWRKKSRREKKIAAQEIGKKKK